MHSDMRRVRYSPRFQSYDEPHGLILIRNAFREKTLIAAKMKEELDEVRKVRRPQFYISKLNIITIEKTGTKDQMKIAKLVEKLFVANISGNTLVSMRASRVALIEMILFREMLQIHKFGSKLLPA